MFANAYAKFGAQSHIIGVSISGSHNIITRSKISSIYGSGIRNDNTGQQTGSLVYGIFLTNNGNGEGHHRATCNTIKDVFAQGGLADNTGSSFDITAEAYGISGISNNQIIVNNRIEEIDVAADIIEFVGGIRVVDENHVVTNNIVKNNGFRSLSRNPADNKDSKVMGISIDGWNIKVENNEVYNNNGYGISASVVSATNLIQKNHSYQNNSYDYIEKENSVSICRNDWAKNQLINATFFPEICFVDK